MPIVRHQRQCSDYPQEYGIRFMMCETCMSDHNKPVGEAITAAR